MLLRLKEATRGKPPATALVFKIKDAKRALKSARERLRLPPCSQRSLRQSLIMRLWKAGVDKKLSAHWQVQGDADASDSKANERAFKCGGRRLSVCHGVAGTRFWIITGAPAALLEQCGTGLGHVQPPLRLVPRASRRADGGTTAAP